MYFLSGFVNRKVQTCDDSELLKGFTLLSLFYAFNRGDT